MGAETRRGAWAGSGGEGGGGERPRRARRRRAGPVHSRGDLHAGSAPAGRFTGDGASRRPSALAWTERGSPPNQGSALTGYS